MYWLRRIPAETRIVVLVVFLALFQAILLSVFGLGAIRGERRNVEEKVRESARDFLRHYVVTGCQNELRDRADEVFLEAYNRGAEGWQKRERVPGGGLFLEAFSVMADESILSSTGKTVLMPRELAVREDHVARKHAAERAERFHRGLVDERTKLALDLEFAESFPLSRDEFGESLALLFAATPLLGGDGSADAATLLRVRWIGVLNRIAELVAAQEVERFLARVDEAGRGSAAYGAGVLDQDRRERIVRALAQEVGRFAPSGPPVLHRNVIAQPTVRFYVRQVGSAVNMQVLALDPARLQGFLRGVARRASERARDPALAGHRPRIVEGDAPAGDPAVAIDALPGFLATTRISPAAVREQAGGRERFYWYIIAFSVVGILAGGFLTSRVVMREIKLAKLKSGFVSNVSHELKTPLTSIRMFAEMLGSGKVTEEAERRECLAVISQETERLGTLIQQVLDFGRLQSRRRRFNWVRGSLAPVVEREVSRFRRATGLDEQRFEAHIAVNLPAVQHDPDAFSEVVANLLSNAFKYTPPESKQIVLYLGPRRGRVVLSVEDNGPGVPHRERRRIFEQFYRSNDLLTREVEGTGLGLSIARNIVRAHGGRILVEDAEEGGSRFVVILPAAARGRPAQTPTPAETT